MEQVDAYCQKYHLEKVAYTLPESRHIQQNLYRHLIFDDSRKLLFCFVPKVSNVIDIYMCLSHMLCSWG